MVKWNRPYDEAVSYNSELHASISEYLHDNKDLEAHRSPSHRSLHNLVLRDSKLFPTIDIDNRAMYCDVMLQLCLAMDDYCIPEINILW